MFHHGNLKDYLLEVLTHPTTRRHGDVVPMSLSRSQQRRRYVQMKHPTMSQWNVAKTSQWYVFTRSYWYVVKMSQGDEMTASYQYVSTTSQITLK